MVVVVFVDTNSYCAAYVCLFIVPLLEYTYTQIHMRIKLKHKYYTCTNE